LLPELLISLVIISIGVDAFPVVCKSSNGGSPITAMRISSQNAPFLGQTFLRRATFFKPLSEILETLNRFNKSAPAWEREDNECLGWPGIIRRHQKFN